MRDLMLQFSNNIFIEILMLADLLIHVNLLAFVPEEYVHDLGVQKLVHRFVNNYTNRVGCGFECAGKKMQA